MSSDPKRLDAQKIIAHGNVEALVDIAKTVGGNLSRQLTTSQSNHRLRASMNELVEMEYVSQLSGQNGKKFEFQLLTTDVKATPTLAGLLRPEELERLLQVGA